LLEVGTSAVVGVSSSSLSGIGQSVQEIPDDSADVKAPSSSSSTKKGGVEGKPKKAKKGTS
jgi:hypothetical protein